MTTQSRMTRRRLVQALAILSFAACGGGDEPPKEVSPFHGTWQYLSGEYHMRCLNDKPLDINLTDKRMGLIVDSHLPNHVQSSYLTPCDRFPGGGLIWTIRGATATVHSTCSIFTYDGTLSLINEGKLTVELTENADEMSSSACKATRKGVLTRISTNPAEATP